MRGRQTSIGSSTCGGGVRAGGLTEEELVRGADADLLNTLGQLSGAPPAETALGIKLDTNRRAQVIGMMLARYREEQRLIEKILES